MTIVKKIKSDLKRRVDKTKKVFLDSGITLLNLACSDHPDRCYEAGKYYLYVGDSEAGKTLFGLLAAANAAIDSKFNDYEIIHDDAENGNGFNLKRFFPKLVGRIKPPKGTTESPKYSKTVEDFYDNLNRLIVDEKKKVIYVLDSMDVLTTRDDLKKTKEQRKARTKSEETGKEVDVSGSYGTAKAKANSGGLRDVMHALKTSGSILIIVTQTRDKLGGMMVYGDNKTRGGGHSLKFYATLELWLSLAEPIKKTVNGKQRVIGNVTKVRVRKNRVQGKHRTVMVPIYPSVGVDEVGGMIDYLLDENHWKKGPGGINAKEFDVKMDREKLVDYIEGDEVNYHELKQLVKSVWDGVEEKCKVVRKNRYG